MINITDIMKKDFRNACNLRIQHDEIARKFFVTIGADEVSVNYLPQEDHHWNIADVVVPSQIRSMNVHARLLEYVLELALQEKITVYSESAYVKTFILRHPRFQALTSEPEIQ